MTTLESRVDYSYLTARYNGTISTQEPSYVATELGVGADDILTNYFTDLILVDPEFTPRPKQEHPRLILVSGHAGSGKTTTANHLAELYDASVIHSDRIRGLLKDNGHEAIGAAIPLVSAVRNELVRRIADGRNIIMDQFINPVRQAVVLENARLGGVPYEAFSLFLETSKNALQRRLEERVNGTGADYKGSGVEILKQQNTIWVPTHDAFNAVCSTEQMTTKEIGEFVRRRLS